MKLYLAGPMRGYPDWNYPAFREAAAVLRSMGHEIFSPAEKDAELGHDPNKDGHLGYKFYMAHDLPAVLASDAVAVLPNWERSKGARLEVHVARECGIPILDAATLDPYSENVCREAERLVYGDRGEAYGHPLDDYECTAAIWSAILGTKVTAEQAVLCMIGVKLSRESRHHKRDNLTDICGYALCDERIIDERKRRA